MIRRTIFLLWWGLLVGQEALHYPFDWGGQLGMIVMGGEHRWRSGWQSGVLIFDPVFEIYPERYGRLYGQGTDRVESLPSIAFDLDSLATESQLDYSRGDYEYNTLELKALFPGDNRVIGLHGFKRTYLGQYAQFLTPDGRMKPLQQSYRIDYRSRSGNSRSVLSVGKYLSDFGVIDTLGLPGAFQEDLTVGGFNYYYDGRALPLAAYLYINHRKWSQPAIFLPISGTRYTSWIKTGFQVTLRSHLSLNGDVQQRLSTRRGKDITDQTWMTLTTRYTGHNLKLTMGGTLNRQSRIYPLGLLTLRIPWKTFFMAAETETSWQPANPVIQELTGLSSGQQTNTLGIQLGRETGALQWRVFSRTTAYKNYTDGTQLRDSTAREENIQDSFLGADASANLSRFNLNIRWVHSAAASRLSMGYRDWTQVTLRYRWELFENNLVLTAETQWDQLKGRNARVQIDPYTGIPFTSGLNSGLSSAPWFIHLKFTAQVSTFTLIWSVNHAAYATRDLWRTGATDVTTMRTNPLLNPAGQLIRFEVIWNFID